jgi:hypothetical protein
MESTALTHLYAENKRLNELVLQLVAECHERVYHARHAEVDLLHQVLDLREKCDTLRYENESLKLLDVKSNTQHEDESSNESKGEKKAARREQLLAKLQDLHTALDGLSTHGSHLHKMVSSFYKSSNNTSTSHNNNVSNPSLSNTQSTVTTSPTIPLITLSSPSQDIIDTTFTSPHQGNDNQPTEHIEVVCDALLELGRLHSLLSPLYPDFGIENLVYSGRYNFLLNAIPKLIFLFFYFLFIFCSTKTAEEELALLEDMIEATFHTRNSYIPTLTLSPLSYEENSMASKPSSSIPRPPPPPPILVSPPPKILATAPSRLEPQRIVDGEARGGLLAAIMAVRPDSEARLLSMEKFVKERIEKKEEDLEDGDREGKPSPLSHMDRLMRALKRVRVDSAVRMAAITQV